MRGKRKQSYKKVNTNKTTQICKPSIIKEIVLNYSRAPEIEQ